MCEKRDGVSVMWNGKSLLYNGKEISIPETLAKQLPSYSIEGELW
jgi:hypothetical protein